MVRLLARIIVEKRVVLIPIALAVVANLAAYVFWLYPLETRVASGESRVAAADDQRRSAERDLAAARATEVGKQRAEGDLKTFYRQVLPGDFAGARKAAYVRLSQLATDANLQYERQMAEEARDAKDTRLARLKLSIVLQGSYADVRKFIHSLETDSDFLVIDNLSLVQSNEANAPLVLTLAVSTYFWTGGNAT